MTLSIVILAAGKGTRMKSAIPKVMHRLAGKTLLEHVITTAQQLAPQQLLVVCGNGSEQVLPVLQQQQIASVMQRQQLGTGHAVQQAITQIQQQDAVLVLYGDVPLIQVATLQKLVDGVNSRQLALLTAKLADPAGYGRIVRNAEGNVMRITEHKDADDATRAIKEINSGIMAMPVSWLTQALEQLDNHNAQGEYYLTDVIALAVADGLRIHTVCCEDPCEVAGVNTRQQLAQLERHYQRWQAEDLMSRGVSLADPDRIDIRGTMEVGQDIYIDINTLFEGYVVLEDNVEIGANCIIKDSVIAEGTTVLANSIIDSSRIGRAVTIGPFARLRPGTVLADKAKIGNFVETKNANIGQGSKVNHLSYIGDTDMGQRVNIGAGTITCNYDGANKHRTIIGDDAFIGSDTQLVAPVKVGKGATLGAGTTLRKDAPEGKLTLTASKQKTIDHWERPAKKN